MSHEIGKFVAQMATKGLTHPGVETFAEQMVQLGAPEGWLGRIGDAVVFITAKQLDEDIPQLAKLIAPYLEDNYVLFTHLPGDSSTWIMEKLKKEGVKPPSEIFSIFNIGENEPTDVEAIRNFLQGRQIAFVDEWIIGGDNLCAIAEELEDDNGTIPLVAGIIYATPFAIQKVQRSVPQVTLLTYKNTIPLLSAKTTKADRGFIARLYRLTSDDRGYDKEELAPDNTLLAGEHKRPDNTPSIFAGRRILCSTEEPIAPLFEDVIPPYKANATNEAINSD